MIYCPEHNAVYAAIQKTGSLSVRRWLLGNYGGERLYGKRGTQKYHRWVMPAWLADRRPFVFTTVRHPEDRLRSLWNFRAVERGEDETFEAMVRHYHQLGHVQAHICDAWIRPHMVLKVESLDDEVWRLPFFDPDKPMPPHRRRLAYVKPLLTEDQIALVRCLYVEDYARFGYA